MSTVTDTTSPTSSNDEPQHIGVDTTLLTSPDFIGVRAALIRLLGNDANRAIVMSRIFFCCDERNRAAVFEDGRWWWRVNLPTMAEETGLSVDQVRRCTRWLEENGYLLSAKHRAGGISDHTMSYRIIDVLESTDDVAAAPDHHVAAAPDLPSTEEVKNTSARKKEIARQLPADWAPTEAHEKLAQERRLDVAHEANLFRLHAETHARTAVRWNAAFTMWLTKATPRQPGAVGAPPAEPYRHPRLLPAGWRDPMLGDPNEPR